MSTDKKTQTIVFGERLKKIRETRKLSQLEVAKATGLQTAAVSHFECGLRAPSFHNIVLLSKALGVSTDYLMGVDTDYKSSPAIGFRNAEKLSDQDKQFIQDLIDVRSKK